MSKKKKAVRSFGKTAALALIKSVLIAVAAELVLVLLFAYLVYQNVIAINLVETLSAVIKLLGAVFAAVMCALFLHEKRIVFCPASSLIYTLVCFLILSAFSGQITFSAGLLRDAAFSLCAGLATACIFNIKK